MKIRVEAVTGRNLEEVCRLRYRVYVEELGFTPPGTDHHARSVTDPLDTVSTVYALLAEDRVLGTVRCTRLSDYPDHPPFQSQPFIDRFRPEEIGSTSRFMLAPESRKSAYIFKLLASAVQFGINHGIRFNFGDTNPFLMDYFEQLGYRRYAPPVNDPIYGLHVPIVMLLRDLGYLREVKSPLLRYVENLSDDDEARTWFSETFPKLARWRTATVLSPDGLMKLSEDFGCPIEAFNQGALGELGDHRDSLLAHTAILEISPGDRVIQPGEVDDTLYICLNGTLVLDEDGHRQTIRPGKAFGITEVKSGQRRQTSVTAETDGLLLVIPARRLRRLIEDTSKPFHHWFEQLSQTA